MRGKPTLTLAQFGARLRTFFLEVYHRRECAKTKRTDRWEENGFLPRIADRLKEAGLEQVRNIFDHGVSV